jgi:hypothetical protein
MDSTVVGFLVILAVVGAIPAWLTGNILKRACQSEAGWGTDWVPLGFLPYGLSRFKHPKKGAIVFGYLVFNLVSWGAIIALIWLFYTRKR